MTNLIEKVVAHRRAIEERATFGEISMPSTVAIGITAIANAGIASNGNNTIRNARNEWIAIVSCVNAA